MQNNQSQSLQQPQRQRSRAQIIKSWRYNPQKQQLNLDGCNDNWVQVLQLQDWQCIKVLWLNACIIDDDNVEQLTNRKWPSLSSLKLQKTKISPNNMNKFLLLSLNIQNLKQLNLSNNKLGTSGTKILPKLNLLQLTKLNLNNCLINNVTSVGNIIKCNIPQLNIISLNQNNLYLDAWHSLMLNNWPNIKKLSIQIYSQYRSIQLLSLILQHKNKNNSIPQQTSYQNNNNITLQLYTYNKFSKNIKQILRNKQYNIW